MQAIAQSDKPVKRRVGKPAAKDIIPATTLIELYLVKRMSQADIARTLGVTPQTISDRLKVLKLDGLSDYKSNRADYLALLQQQITSAISVKDVQKAPLKDKVVAAGILYDKERLERNLSTSNVSVLSKIVAESEDDSIINGLNPFDAINQPVKQLSGLKDDEDN